MKTRKKKEKTRTVYYYLLERWKKKKKNHRVTMSWKHVIEAYGISGAWRPRASRDRGGIRILRPSHYYYYYSWFLAFRSDAKLNPKPGRRLLCVSSSSSCFAFGLSDDVYIIARWKLSSSCGSLYAGETTPVVALEFYWRNPFRVVVTKSQQRKRFRF